MQSTKNRGRLLNYNKAFGIMIVLRLSHLVLVVLCAFGTVIDAYDLSTKRPADELGPLGVTIDYGLAKSWPESVEGKGTEVSRNWVWTSHLIFNDTIRDLSPGQLWKIAKDAYDEIENDMTFYGIGVRKNKPQAMGVLAYGNELILASSKKGGNSIGYEFAKTKVLNPLLLCQTVWNDITSIETPHVNKGRCGEVLAAQLYYTKYNRPSALMLDEVNPRAATVVNGSPAAPCGHDKEDTWGCDLFVASEGIKYMDPNAPMEDYDLATITGKMPDVTQIPLCSKATPTPSTGASVAAR